MNQLVSTSCRDDKSRVQRVKRNVFLAKVGDRVEIFRAMSIRGVAAHTRNDLVCICGCICAKVHTAGSRDLGWPFQVGGILSLRTRREIRLLLVFSVALKYGSYSDIMRLSCVGSGILYELLDRLETIDIVRPGSLMRNRSPVSVYRIKRYVTRSRVALPERDGL